MLPLETLMRTSRYSHNKAKNNFRTKEIAIRGFVRDLKSRLLSGQEYSLEKGEYRLVAKAFEMLTSRIDVSLLDEFYDEETKTYEISFVESSCYSKWWNGHQYPDNRNKKLIEMLFPGLLCKWFDRSNFRDRLQLHMASLDLFSFSDNCNCEYKKASASTLYCEKCLTEALNEASWIIKAIHQDWKPEKTGFNKIIDVCITGPIERSGLNVSKNKFDSIEDPREQVDFNLSLGATSFVGLNLPKNVVELYQDENSLSVVVFLFSLIALDFKTESEYRDDLVLDYLTALNCAGFYLFLKHGLLFKGTLDPLEDKLQYMLLYSSEFFYDEPIDLKKALTGFEDLIGNSPEEYESLQTSIDYPMIHFDCHSGFKLTEIFFEIMNFSLTKEELKNFMENIKDYCFAEYDSNSIVDEYLAEPSSRVFKSFEAARARYLNLFSITGYSRKELINELSKTIKNPVARRTTKGSTPQKETAY